MCREILGGFFTKILYAEEIFVLKIDKEKSKKGNFGLQKIMIHRIFSWFHL